MNLRASLRDVAESRKHRLKERGIVNPIWTSMAAKKAGLRLYLACALLEKESGGGRNVFGHDRVATGGCYLKDGASVWEAAKRYNGASSYADHFVQVAEKWRLRFERDKTKA